MLSRKKQVDGAGRNRWMEKESYTTQFSPAHPTSGQFKLGGSISVSAFGKTSFLKFHFIFVMIKRWFFTRLR